MIDETDRTLLRLLQDNARVSNAELARALDMAPSAILERVRKLEARGIVRGYAADLDPLTLGVGLLAFVFVRTEEPVGSHSGGVELGGIPEVLEVHHVAGEDCYLLKIRVADTAALGRLLRDRIGTIPQVRSTRTTIVLETLKESVRLPFAPLSSELTTPVDAKGGDDD